MMEFSAPTAASHPLADAEATDRDTKRRKLKEEPQVPDNAMMDTNASAMTTQASTADMSMEIDTQPSTASSSTSSNNYAHPSSSNQFNGNALSDEELVYQVMQSGAESYSEVVQFCVSRGISVSRILQMDIMRRLSYLRAG
ncbi:expressed unknown protein [Seminavis robusta]|uniref:Uncharacterized protein n=1 Tax=Seminavis robusta TaxID=568900 RepID=A0A9N8H193_9STRA|nr:expressed unknown protein [Seminavis robusta]|eukprot:Sro1_g000560.1 n/a (141) ;mRNA; r:161579-162323